MQGAEADEGKPVADVQHLAWTPLHISAAQGHTNAIPLLVTAGCDVNAGDAEGNTALHLAAGNGHGEVVLCLLQLRADVTAVNQAGRTPLAEAKENGQDKVVRILQEFGAKA